MAQNRPHDEFEATLKNVTPLPRPADEGTAEEDGDKNRQKPREGYARGLAIFAASLVGLILVLVGGILAFAIYDPDRFQLSLQQARTLFDSIPIAANGQPAGAPLSTDSDPLTPQLVEQGSQSESTPDPMARTPTKKDASPEIVQLPIPNVDGLVMLIRKSLNALNQANRTGNYSILRELSGSDLQKTNSGARLNEAFATLRGRHVDLLAVNATNPRLIREPWIDEEGRLRLIGFFPTRPEQINFEMIFQPEGETWRLFGLGVDTVPPAADAPQPEGAAQAPPVAAREPPARAPQINR